MKTEEIKQFVLESYNFRHACKIFDAQKKISNEDFSFILESARLSPTSFGMQGIKLLMIEDDTLRAEIKKAAWNQNQIDTSSHLVVFTTKTKDLEPGSEWVKSRFADRSMPVENQQAYYKKYNEFHTNLKERIEGYFKREATNFIYRLFHKNRNNKDIYQWGARQSYILLGNMMSSAAMIGIDSCPIEGFDKNKVEEILNIDTNQEEVCVICAFGYRVNKQPEKKRLPIETITQYFN